jgi:hypothetical protein
MNPSSDRVSSLTTAFKSWSLLAAFATFILASCQDGSRLSRSAQSADHPSEDAADSNGERHREPDAAAPDGDHHEQPDATVSPDISVEPEDASVSPDAIVSTPADVGLALDASGPQIDAGPCPTGPDNLYCSPSGQWIGPPSDGPAHAPLACVYTAASATPSPGANTTLLPTDDLTAAYNAARCGDTLLLAAGGSYQLADGTTGKGCDDSHWITIRNATGDTAIPPEGTRITPCAIGLASLPNRPPYTCANPINVLPRIINASLPTLPIDHVRFVGVEFARDPSYSTPPPDNSIVYGLVDLQGASKVIFDRVIMHGDGVHETTRGIFLDGSTNIAVVDSYFYDFFCESAGVCTDAQSISGGVGVGDMGPYKIVNNFLESAAENILFGGDWSDHVPHDIEVRRNHLFKPMSWMPGPGAVVGPAGSNLIVKNLFELKSADRVWFEANLGENVWGGFSQNGHPLLLTPANTTGSPVQARVTDTTVRYSLFRNSCVGLSLASQDGSLWQNNSLHDLVLDGINTTRLSGCGGYLNEIGSGQGSQNLTVTHVTEVNDPGSYWNNGWIIGTSPTQNVSWTNSISLAAQYSMWSFGVLGECNSTDVPATAWPACFPNGIFAGNVIAEDMGSQWPSGNFFPADDNAVGFVSFNGGIGGDYHLAQSSPYKGMATDGRDPGADIDALEAYLSCVQ